jgi:hypothetical protein
MAEDLSPRTTAHVREVQLNLYPQLSKATGRPSID